MAAIGGDSSSKGMRREFTCNSIMGPATTERFSYQNADGKSESLTVAQYFYKVKGVRYCIILSISNFVHILAILSLNKIIRLVYITRNGVIVYIQA